jgi:hypothetical protein
MTISARTWCGVQTDIEPRWRELSPLTDLPTMMGHFDRRPHCPQKGLASLIFPAELAEHGSIAPCRSLSRSSSSGSCSRCSHGCFTLLSCCLSSRSSPACWRSRRNTSANSYASANVLLGAPCCDGAESDPGSQQFRKDRATEPQAAPITTRRSLL